MSAATYRRERERKEKDADEGEKFYILAQACRSSALDNRASIEQLKRRISKCSTAAGSARKERR